MARTQIKCRTEKDEADREKISLINEDLIKRKEFRGDTCWLDDKFEPKDFMKKDGNLNNLDKKAETYLKIYDSLGLSLTVSNHSYLNPLEGFNQASIEGIRKVTNLYIKK